MRRPSGPVLRLAGGLLAAVMLASCTTVEEAPPLPPAGGLCRIGPDGGPLLAERGIGGTGAPGGEVVSGPVVGPPAPPPGEAAPGRPGGRGIGGTGGLGTIAGGVRLAERGIGGTGLGAGSVVADPAASPGNGAVPAPRPGDRGIGGTGVVGVITGFGSVCVDGLEVALAPATVVAVDGVPATATALRAGQLVALRAADAAEAPRADALAVRHEVVGPAHDEGSGVLEVAGQRVLVGPETRGALHPAPGAVVAVSGLRDATGAVVATRVDLYGAAVPKQDVPALVHGTLRRDEGGLWLGALPVSPAPGVLVPGDGPVIATGVLENGRLSAATLAPDLLASDPVAFFGATVNRYVLESFVDPASSRLLLGQALRGTAVPGGRSVMAFERGTAGIALVSTRSAAAAAAVLDAPGHAMGDAGMFAPGAGGPAGLGSGWQRCAWEIVWRRTSERRCVHSSPRSPARCRLHPVRCGRPPWCTSPRWVSQARIAGRGRRPWGPGGLRGLGAASRAEAVGRAAREGVAKAPAPGGAPHVGLAFMAR